MLFKRTPRFEIFLRFLPAAVVVVAVCALIVQVALAFPALLEEIRLPYSVNLWSEGPILVQIHRIALGTPIYRPLTLADSWIYGPAYPYLLAGFDRVVQVLPTIVPLRFISMFAGLSALIPLVWAVRIAAKRFPQPRALWPTVIAAFFVGAAYLLVDSRAPTFVALHPDELTFLLIAIAIAVTFAYARGPRKPVLLVTLLVVCLIDGFAKLTTGPYVFFFLAALVIEGTLAWRAALVWAGVFVVAFALCYLALPSAAREWTIVIPSHHTFISVGLTLQRIWQQWVIARPFTGWLVLAMLAGATYRLRTAGPRAAIAMLCVPLGVFATGTAALATLGGGPNDLWPTYVTFLVPLGALLDEFLTVTSCSAFVAAAFVLALPVFAALGPDAQVPLNPIQRAQMSYASDRLAALCKPSHTIFISALVDPLLNCPGVRFTLWDSIGEIRWAQRGGFKTKTPFDDWIEPDAYVDLLEHPYSGARVFGFYQRTILPIYNREPKWDTTLFEYLPQRLEFWVKVPQPGAGNPQGNGLHWTP